MLNFLSVCLRHTLHQAIDAVEGVMLGRVGQVGIANGRQNRLMAEDLLYLEQIDPGFD